MTLARANRDKERKRPAGAVAIEQNLPAFPAFPGFYAINRPKARIVEKMERVRSNLR